MVTIQGMALYNVIYKYVKKYVLSYVISRIYAIVILQYHKTSNQI